MIASLAALCLAVGAVQDTVLDAGELQRLARHGADSALARAVRASPVAARDALQELLKASAGAAPEAPMQASSRLAGTLARELGDSFPMREVGRFAAWSPEHRREKVAIDSVRRAGNAAFRRDGFVVALPLWQQSVARAVALKDTAGVAAATGNIGAGWYAEGQLDSAAAAFRTAASLATSVGDRRTALNALGALANVHRDRGELEAARTLYQETSRLREQVGDARGLIADQVNVGVLSAEIGDLAGAATHYQAALARSMELGLEEPAAASRVNLGQLAVLVGDFASAGREYQAALTTYRRLGYRSDQALVLRSLGLMEARRGDYRTARARFQESLAIAREVGPRSAIVRAQLDLAAVGVATGQADAARRRVDSATALALAPPADPALHAEVALAEGDMHAAFNRQAAAERAYRRAELLFQRAADEGGRAQAMAGRGYLLLGDASPGDAIPVLDRAARIQGRTGDARAAALTRLDLASALSQAGQPAEAARMAAVARDSLAALRDVAGQAAATGFLADLDLVAGRPAQAEAQYRSALALAADPALLQVRWPLYLGLARALEAQGSSALARTELERAVGAVEASAASLSTDHRSAWLADKWEPWSMLAQLEVQGGRDSAAFAVSEQLRARELMEQLTRARVATRPGSDSALVAEEQELRRTITALAGTTDGTTWLGPAVRGARAAAAPAAQREALAEAEARYATVLERVRDREPAWARTVRQPAVSWRDVASRLPAGTAFLEYLVSDSASLLFVIAAGQLRVFDLGVDQRTLASLVDFARGALAEAPKASRPGPAPAALERLHRILVEPARTAGALQGITQLIVVPHGELHYLPFAALKASGPGGRYLVETFDIAVALSAASWMQVMDRPPPTATGVLALAPAGASLPGTLAEVRAIGSAWQGQAELLTGPAAGKAEVMARAGSAGILHIASYGVLNRRNPLFSYVELAPAGRVDGRLEVHEVYGLALDARVVVLSACQTGVGSGMLADVPPGDDWVSLSRAFLVAGARRVVASLWLVEDRATADLMASFHRELAGGAAAAAALGRAQRTMLAQPARAHPFYWAGFTTIGGP